MVAKKDGVHVDLVTLQWSWHCSCGAEGGPFAERAGARASYKEHRAGACPNRSSTRVEETVPMEKTTETANPKTGKVAAKKKAAPKKVAKKKTAKKAAKVVAKKKTAKKREPKTQLRRIGFGTNPKTKRTVMMNVSKSGGVFPRQQERLGFAKADRWVEVRADSHAKAMVAVAAGEGEWFGPGKKKKMGKGKSK